MRIGYFDCFAGASGDMILAALIGAGVELEDLRRELAKLPLTGYELDYYTTDCHGLQAGRFEVRLTESSHGHRDFATIRAMIEASPLSPAVRQTALEVFRRLAEAEGRVHGRPPEQVTFHEVGAVDSIVDIVGAAVALERLGLDRIECSAIPVGGGTVSGAHGLLPVPAPATAELLRGVPLAPSVVASEMTTPTGAAILTTVAVRFGPLPGLRLERISYGAGRRRFAEMPNVLRLMIGQAEAAAAMDRVWVLETTVDDASGEMIGYTLERLLAEGALDAFVAPIQMKKNRPGVLITVLSEPDRIARLEGVLFEETGTFGVRRYAAERTKRHRRALTVQTPLGPVLGKLGWLDGQGTVFSPEYEDCRRLARERGLPLRDVYQMALEAYGRQAGQDGPPSSGEQPAGQPGG